MFESVVSGSVFPLHAAETDEHAVEEPHVFLVLVRLRPLRAVLVRDLVPLGLQADPGFGLLVHGVLGLEARWVT